MYPKLVHSNKMDSFSQNMVQLTNQKSLTLMSQYLQSYWDFFPRRYTHPLFFSATFLLSRHWVKSPRSLFPDKERIHLWSVLVCDYCCAVIYCAYCASIFGSRDAVRSEKALFFQAHKSELRPKMWHFFHPFFLLLFGWYGKNSSVHVFQWR